jgi:hypothetical protein
MSSYGYVNPGGQEAISSEIIHRIKGYFEAKKLMRECQNLSLFIALKHFSDEIVMK